MFNVLTRNVLDYRWWWIKQQIIVDDHMNDENFNFTLTLLINGPKKNRLTVPFSNRLHVLADFAYQMPLHDRMTPTATKQSRAQTGLPSSFHNTLFSDSTHYRTQWKFSVTSFTNFWPWKGPLIGFILKPSSNPGRFRTPNGDTELDAASALRGQRHLSIGQYNDVNTLERCSCGCFAALMVGNPSRFFSTGGLPCPRRNAPVETMVVWQFSSPLSEIQIAFPPVVLRVGCSV